MKGAIGYYAFLLVFIVTFVAIAGMQRHGAFDGITGYAVDASAVPQIGSPETIAQEVTAYLPQPIKPVGFRRVLVIPNPDADAAVITGIAELRHQFPDGFSADVRETDLLALAELADIHPLPVYTLPAFPVPPTGSPLIVLGGVGTYPHQVYCRDFTRGPEVRSCPSPDDDPAIGESAISSYVVCDVSGMCFADDIAAALTYAAAQEPGTIFSPFSEPLPLITAAKKRVVAAGSQLLS